MYLQTNSVNSYISLGKFQFKDADIFFKMSTPFVSLKPVPLSLLKFFGLKLPKKQSPKVMT